MCMVGDFIHLLIPCPSQDVYGVLRTLEGLDVFADLIKNTQIGPWYFAMKEQVHRQNGRPR